MINKDYILRLAEEMGRELSIILGLRKRDKQEDALIYIDTLLLKTVGMTSRFINSLSEEILTKTLSPLEKLNVDATLWIATLLKAEAEIYTKKGNSKECYYRSLKALYLYLTVLEREPIEINTTFYSDVKELLSALDDYELPIHVRRKLINYYEHLGNYGKAEDTLFSLLEQKALTGQQDDQDLLQLGQDFYTRLLAKSDADLQAGNLAKEEVQEGLLQLRDRA